MPEPTSLVLVAVAAVPAVAAAFCRRRRNPGDE
ncbi:MAG: PEP-CTERM sorting domain-containing protein [Pirellulales bacterium]|nr:PEP-CTERM sorting domain-containing protein [Pirellulales bacterium]